MFMNDLKETLDNRMQRTENGALGWSTTGKHLLDLNYSITSLRNKSEEEIANRFAKAFYEDKLLAVKWAFYARDAREGVGERRTFRVIMKYLAENHPDVAKAVVELIPEYGRFDDLWVLLDTDLRKDVIKYVKKQLNEDAKNMLEGRGISLTSKWMPSLNASSKETKRLARILRKGLGLSKEQYRKMLSKLRAYLDVVETKMSAKKWSEIDYNAVPSRANLIYNKAFLRNDEERRRAYLAALERGDKNVKINAGVLFPDDIVRKYSYGTRVKPYDATLEELWKALPTLTSENTLVVRDGSGSMTWSGGKPMDVSTALAIYMAERNQGEFHNQFITFSTSPKIIDLNGCKTLHDKLDRTYREADCSNTNIEAVFKLILHTAVRKNMTQEDMPKNIVIISDMQYDAHSHNFTDTLFDAISKEYAGYGYLVPRLIFWNVNGRSNDTIPVKQNELGVVLMSGYSQNLIKMIMSNSTDPFECLLEQLNTERYAPVEDAIKDIVN